ncbi:MAG: hypothetical protein A2Y24_06470 [Clostridiales bacterium GWE2_32_10]|nr:MAG: hypothetical protein A2Y24_06470 [Clostridiales bacterium GWE2_32_10]HBY20845.1 spore coat associated protein CotJA [Clostridiales bacterium]
MSELNKEMVYEDLETEHIRLPKVYVVNQPYIDRFPLPEALKKGTIFPNLYDPYMAKMVKNKC